MPKIISVEPQKKNPRRFNIFLDGVFAFGADEDLVVNYHLVPGKIVQPRELEKLLFESEVGKLMERMYGLFSVRMRSEKEVRDYLKNLSFKRKTKGKEEISDLVIDILVERLKQKGMLNDLEFAKAWVEGRRRSKQKGVRALKAELYQKGIDREIVEEVLRLADARSGQVSEEDLAKLALEKKMKSWKNLPELEFKKKAIEFLLRRGFEYSIVRVVVAKLGQKR
ncbi:MAG: regulatory protein [Candidatus Daviesbacteria bacterium GW2011_GWA1_41_61]|uniref:Regulatory protein RecX n=1 Tax=Candidatus Daviesbacteria bacterium GW2011_GWA2_40_9 TaxID=1618424 RepID=A0A0G0U075_9BACT|nr:MAG: regulatory protein [Candidatus Daviesbacteria bacterium GW2011_GWC1_40_9]KKR82483.1 MAG: regulatory protein [Candidatus Daviesbacteria bacterium GW2011_GWA2_40_9]KKR93158.1 MAG: regulatory protein [Candidatus Daviesbacteria bacterium GW2011_GWB1_41_15]KKS15702.1 MAG: regulatory protein [Candidatus Daviesbacteria bacterium GW2011_GWA1_41_61]